MPVSPDNSPRPVAGLNSVERTFLPGRDNPVVLSALSVVPWQDSMTWFAPAVRAYEPVGSQATANRGCPVPEESGVIVAGSVYFKAVPESPTRSTELPFGFQLIE